MIELRNLIAEALGGVRRRVFDAYDQDGTIVTWWIERSGCNVRLEPVDGYPESLKVFSKDELAEAFVRTLVERMRRQGFIERGTTGTKRRYLELHDDRGVRLDWVLIESDGTSVDALSSAGEKSHGFRTVMLAARFVDNTVSKLVARGWRERKLPERHRYQTSVVDRKTRRVYGTRGIHPAHTRYKSEVYLASPGTRFEKGDHVYAVLDNIGRLIVRDPVTGHTERWIKDRQR